MMQRKSELEQQLEKTQTQRIIDEEEYQIDDLVLTNKTLRVRMDRLAVSDEAAAAARACLQTVETNLARSEICIESNQALIKSDRLLIVSLQQKNQALVKTIESIRLERQTGRGETARELEQRDDLIVTYKCQARDKETQIIALKRAKDAANEELYKARSDIDAIRRIVAN